MIWPSKPDLAGLLLLVLGEERPGIWKVLPAAALKTSCSETSKGDRLQACFPLCSRAINTDLPQILRSGTPRRSPGCKCLYHLLVLNSVLTESGHLGDHAAELSANVEAGADLVGDAGSIDGAHLGLLLDIQVCVPELRMGRKINAPGPASIKGLYLRKLKVRT